MTQQTAVEWFVTETLKLIVRLENKELTIPEYASNYIILYQQAKAMEKEQIEMAYHNGYSDAIQSEPKQYEPEQYYNKTYNK